jgi:hypothetical protein
MHTKYSVNHDCNTTLEEIIARCQKKGINCIAISDHGSADGALEMHKIAPFKVIVAEEILTPDGEIVGMFLKKTIPSGITLEEAVAEIKSQGGLVSVPHPFDPLRGLKLGKERMEKLAEQLDMIEVFNARGPFSGPVAKTRALAEKHDLPMTAGSDAHYPFEIGYTYVEMPEFEGRDDFLQALRQGTIHKQRAGAMVYIRTGVARLAKAISGK